MINHALLASGARVVMMSCSNENYPPTSIIDGRLDTFWMTTGLYPQCFVIAFSAAINVDTIIMQSYNAKGVVIEGSAENEAINFSEIISEELPANNGGLQKSTFPAASAECRFLKVTITSGHDNFCAICCVQVSGS